MKGNQRGLKEALETWLAYTGKARLEAPPDWEEVRKGHGRIEQRQLWLVPCEDEMQTYLERDFDWPKVQWCGWIVRQRRSLRASAWESRQVHLWVAGAAFSWPLSASQAARRLRGHWSIENTVFYVRDVSMDEDRLHGRKIAAGLSGIRNVVLNLLRRLIRASSIPEARRKVAAMPDYGLHLLFIPLPEL